MKKIFFLALVTLLLFAACGGHNDIQQEIEETPAPQESTRNIDDDEIILVFEGTEVSAGDMRFFVEILGDSREIALQSLLTTMVILERGELHGVLPTEDEMVEFLGIASGMREYLEMVVPGGMDYISDERIAQIYSIDSVAMRLMDIYVDFIPDEDEINEYMDDNMDEIILYSTDMSFKYIITYDANDIAEAHSSLEAGMDFDEANVEFNVFHEMVGIEIIEYMDFLENYTNWEHHEVLADLEMGEYTEVLEVQGMFFIALMYEKSLNPEMLEENIGYIRSLFIDERRNQLFSDMVAQWIEEADYSVNEDVMSRF
ncbi:MAG: hypothetical protein LBI27_06885 [Clostridiales bacterium]|jgi:hypothetical protein|nr:hypothetical protein [Clostridiales bacterium]